MESRTLIILWTALFLSGCAKQENPATRPIQAINGLMPGGSPQFESVYVADQSQIKTLPLQEVKYESLETLRAAREQAAENPPPAGADSGEAAEPEVGGEETKSAGKKVGGLIGALGEKLKSVAKKSEKSAAKEKVESTPKSEKAAAKKPETAKKPSLQDGTLKRKEKTDEVGEDRKDKQDDAKAEEGKESSGEKAAENGEKPDEEKAEASEGERTEGEGTEDREGREGAEKPEGDQEKKDEGGGGDRGGG